jgi:thiamine-monophosphate kinase
MSGGGDEFELIARHFVPLASSFAARGLRDDAALLDGAGPLVVTADTIVEGVHFLPSDPIDLVARKALRVNISDAAAKGAAPLHYLLALQWPRSRPADDISAFAAGLAADQAIFGCTLIGGDTTSTPGPLAAAITLLGRPSGATPSRACAQIGDDLWVSGTIGDGALGLEAALGRTPTLGQADVDALIARYRLPQPRVGLAAVVATFATASMDVSDGLLGDARKIAAASGVRLTIRPEAVPISAAGRAWLTANPDGLAHLLNGGDDYEILFTAPPVRRAAIVEASADVGVVVSRIGGAAEGAGVEAGGLPIGGHVHRIGS